MFGLFGKKPSPTSAPAELPQPLAGRDGHVGGIESIVLDGRPLYFGFDYGSDLVVSPLIDDVGAMARFAARHMRLRDGPHDEAYWREAAGYPSQLCSDEAGRTFSSVDLAAGMDRLRKAEADDMAVPGFGIEYHLLYLLGAAGGWVVTGDDAEEAGELMAILAGEEPLPEGRRYAEIAAEILDHLAALIDTTPENWSTRFAMLRG